MLAAMAVPDVAAAHSHHERRIHSVTLSPDGGGTLIAIRFVDRARPRLLHLAEPVDALAVRDVDNDGDLDILTASNTRGLVLWRNAGRGHFELAGRPSKRPPRPPLRTVRHRTAVNDGPAASDDRCGAAAPRGPCAIPPAPASHVAFHPTIFRSALVLHPRYGRAPPR